MSAEGIVIGIDGGGSETVAWALNSSGTVVACATGGTLDVEAIGEDGLRGALRSLRASLLDQYGEASRHVCGVVVGMPLHGEGRDVTRTLDGICSEIFPEPLRVVNDVRVGHEAAFNGTPGIVIEAGTGSMAWARTLDGREGRCGGWGDAFGDEGSAYYIGVEALRQASQMWDGRVQRSSLLDALLDVAGTDDFSEVPQWSLQGRRRRVASLARVVDTVAEDGDRTATQILHQAGNELARLCIALKRRFFKGKSPQVARYGGVFRSRTVTNAMNACLAQAGIGDSIPAPRPPVAGACLLASKLAGWETQGPAEQLTVPPVRRDTATRGMGNVSQKDRCWY